MRLASLVANAKPCLGLGVDAVIVDLSGALRAFGAAPPHDMLELIETFAELRAALAAIEGQARANPAALPLLDAAAVTWRAPVPNPSKICCLALNNSANSERILQGPKHPATFIKPSSALIGHGQAIECRPSYGRVHPEPELAFVVGRKAKSVRAEDAMDHVFGYTIHNDITSPTMRGEDTFHYRAIHPAPDDSRQIDYVDTWVSYPGRYKCADTFSSMGPWLVTKDEIADPHDLAVSCRHKGEIVTEDNTENLFFDIAATIAFVSGYMTLLPGDVVSMGTALKASAGGTAVQTIDLNRLGGPISVSIDRLGTLSNPVVHLA